MTCKDCIHSGLCYKENDYENFPDRCGNFIPEIPQGDLISREALKDATKELYDETLDGIVKFGIEKVYDLIENVQSVEFPEQITIKCDTEEDEQKLLSLIANAKVCRFAEPDMEIAAGKCPIETGGNCPLRSQGEWVRKEDVIHSIAKQYSEHNELVPIWLSIGDIKGGAE